MSNLHGLAGTLCAVGRCAEAVPVMEEALRKGRASGSPKRLAGMLMAASGIYREAGQLDSAGAVLREAETLLAQGAMSTGDGMQRLDRHRARLALARGDARDALRLARRAWTYETDAARTPGHTIALLLLESDALAALGDWNGAAAAAERALAGARQRQGELAHSSGVGQALLAKARALAGRGAGDLARPVLRESLEHLRESVGPDAHDTRAAEALLARLG
jgi:tetratricopeptide (TPR) repeat protein